MTPVFVIRKRPLRATAMPFVGDNADDIVAWVTAGGGEAYLAEGNLYIVTDRGDVVAEPGDTIVKGLVGEYYPTTPESYAAGWELVGIEDQP